MKAQLIEAFLDSITGIFSSFGFGEVVRGVIHQKESFVCKYNLTTVIGISGNVRGNMALSMPYDTARKIASAMMMGMEVSEIDEISVSALGEMTNMICGQAVMGIQSPDLSVDITPPTIIHGEKMKAIISQVETVVVEISSALGVLELNLGLEG